MERQMCYLIMRFSIWLLLKLELAGEDRGAGPWNLGKGKSSLVKLLEKRLDIRTSGFTSLHWKRGSSLKGKTSFRD